MAQKEKNHRRFWIILVVAAAFLLFGVPALLLGLGATIYKINQSSTEGFTSSSGYDYSGQADYETESYSAAPKMMEAAEDAITVEATIDAAVLESTEPRVIKTGTLRLTVDNTEVTVTEISGLVKERGGFVQDSYTYTTAEDRLAGEMTMRVPSDKFEGLLEAVKDKAKVVTSEDISGQDVTEDYIDLQSRLKSLQSQEAQYNEILKQAKNVEDILKVTTKLDNVRVDIETVQGRINYLENKTDYATLTVYLSEKTELGAALTDKWQPSENMRQAFRAWVKMLQNLTDGLVWLLIFLGPPAIVIYLLVKFILWRVRQRKSKSK